jgi:hypothetical protein
MAAGLFCRRRERQWLAPVALLLLLQPASAQTRFAYLKGQSVSPVYEGWKQNEDGSFTMYFGYMNPNYLEEFDVPIGPDNSIEPGGPDQGQPTHFYPRRTKFLFTVRVPKDFGDKELIWTLRTRGRTERAYGTLHNDYVINNQVISIEVGGDFGSFHDETRDNIPPDLNVEGEKHRSVRVGESLTLVAVAGDPDNFPPRADGKPQPGVRLPSPKPRAGPRRSANLENAEYRFPQGINVITSGPGLRLSWIVYRGEAAAVTFSPEQMKTWVDTRWYANSPWSPPYIIPEPPPDGKWVVQTTFQEPGTYVLRVVASDSSLFIYEDVTVTVSR